jgi:hypothetical protein
MRTSTICPSCGCELTKPRSGADHRRFFAGIRAAYFHWRGDFTPTSEDQLRAYLLIRVGHFDVTSIPAPEGISEHETLLRLFRLSVEAAATALQRAYPYVDVRISAAGAEIFTPRSIDYRTVSQREFGPIRDAVEAYIEAQLGVPMQRLLAEQAA